MTNEEFIESIRLEGEEWRDVVGYEGRYIVSNKGRIACLAFDIITHPYGKEHILHRDAHLLTPTKFKNTQYYYVMFRKDGKRSKYLLHRLVAIAFIPNPSNLPQVDHIDGDRLNNDVNNLRWCSPSGNMANTITQSRVLKGRERIGFPYRIPIVQLKNDKVVKLYDNIYSTKQDGFNPSSVNRCCHGILKSHRGYTWMKLSDYESLVSMSKNSTDLSAD